MKWIIFTVMFGYLATIGVQAQICVSNIALEKYAADNKQLNQIDSLGRKQGVWVVRGKECLRYGGYNSSGEVFDSCQVCFMTTFTQGAVSGKSYWFNSKGALLVMNIPFESVREPVKITYYESGYVKTKEYHTLSQNGKNQIPSETILYADSVQDCALQKFWVDGSAATYTNCKMTSRTSSKYYGYLVLEEPNSKDIPYAVEKGVFRNDRLYNGHIYYYDTRDSLQKTVVVTNGKHSHDATLVFKNEALFNQLINHMPRVDIDHSGTIEFSEAEQVHYLSLRLNEITDTFELRYFKNLVQVHTFSDDGFGPVSLKDPDAIIEWPEEPATYKGGQDAFISYLDKNRVYPQTALDAGTQGTVYVSFIVEKDGSISNVVILKGISPDIDKEALRLIRAMPKWNAAIHQNETVRSKVILPVKFVIP